MLIHRGKLFDSIIRMPAVLKFLRVRPFDTDSAQFRSLLTPALAPYFARFVSSIGIRTLKANVADELALPKQTRISVPIDLSAVERCVA